MTAEASDQGPGEDRTVTAAALNRKFGLVQEWASRQPVIVTHHGRPKLALVSLSYLEAIRARASDPHSGLRRQLTLTLENIREGFVAVDLSLRIVTVNRLAEILLGSPREELIGRQWNEAALDPNWTRFSSQLTRVIEHGAVLTTEMQLRANGERTVEIQAFPLPPPRMGAGVLFFNVSEARRIEERMLEAEDKLASLSSVLSRYAVIGLTLDQRISEWNAGAETILGWRQGEIVGQSLSTIATSHTATIFRQSHDLGVDGNRSSEQKTSWRHRNGTTVTLDTKVATSRTGLLVLLTDPELAVAPR